MNTNEHVKKKINDKNEEFTKYFFKNGTERVQKGTQKYSEKNLGTLPLFFFFEICLPFTKGERFFKAYGKTMNSR